MPFSNLIELAISLVLEIWLMILLLRRHAYRPFPVFFSFTMLEVLAVAARLAVNPHYRSYFYVYWWTEAVLLPLSVAALHEVFHWMFEGFYRLWWFRLFYYGTVGAVLALAVSRAILLPPVQAHPLISLILDLGIGVYFVRGGIVALFIVLTKLLEVEFRRYAYGIMVGFGITSAGPLLGYLLRSEFGTKVQTFTIHASAVAYIVALAVWVSAFIRPEPEEGEWGPPISPERMLEEAQSYLKALGIGRPKR